ncbi:MAG: hypothetical protein ACXVLQ_12410 [Bacteriovorax sp.]
MKKLLSSLFAILMLSACSSNMTYNQDKNCSERGKAQLSLDIGTTSEEDKSFFRSKTSEIKSMLINKLTPELNACYQKYLSEAVHPREFSICTVTTVKGGKPIFIDVADQVNLLNDELQACMVKKFQEADWSFINRKSPLTIIQPINLRAKRN